MSSSQLPLAIDLDGTLVFTDLTFETIIRFVQRNPLRILMVLWWLVQGRSVLKAELGQRLVPAAATLPYNEALLEYIRAARAKGRRVVLATASDQTVADAVAEHCGCFDAAYGSSRTVNLRSKAKCALLTEQFGERGFVYAGNSSADYEVWRGSAAAVVVAREAKLLQRAMELAPVEASFSAPALTVATFLKSLRYHQWVKNLLVFVPLFVAHLSDSLDRILSCVIAFAALSVTASAVYLMNDLFDLDADRAHRTKKFRSLASGALQIHEALLLIPLLLLGGFYLCSALGIAALQVLALYLVVTFAYSLRVKQVPVLDIVTLAGLYSVRIYLGAAATAIVVSNWLLAFSAFFFFGLAAVKRVAELVRVLPGQVVSGRGYRPGDTAVVSMMGVASSFTSVLVLALYMNSVEVSSFYTHPDLLWLVCVVVFLWIARVWMKVTRGELEEDPVVFALRDKSSYLLGFLALWCTWLAI